MSETEDKRAANQEYCDQNYNTAENISISSAIYRPEPESGTAQSSLMLNDFE